MTLSLFRFEHEETDDSGDQQFLKGKGVAGEELTGVHRVMPFGFASHAPKGAHSLAVAAHGQRDLVVALGVEDAATRQKNLPQGTGKLYDAQGNVIFMAGLSGLQSIAKAGKNRVQSEQDDVIVEPKPSGGKQVYLGGDPAKGHIFSPVVTVAGPSPYVQARIG